MVNLHVLLVASSSILVIGGDVQFCSSLDWEISITNSVTGTDLWALGVKSNGELTARLNLLGFTGVVNDRLVVLVRAVGEVHANN